MSSTQKMTLLHDAGLVRTRACRHGVLSYLTTDEHVGRSLDTYGEWAQAELELLSLFLQAGQVVLDVGANLGTHTVFFAQKVGPSGAVFAFEPQRVVHQLLSANVVLNGHFNVRTVHGAVGAEPGQLLVPDIDYANAGNFGGVGLGEWKEGEVVQVLPLDALDLAACHLLKVDVEGMELAVLRGARALLERHRPVLYLENNGPAGAPDVVSLLLSLGYTLRWHFSPFFRADNFAGATHNVFGPVVDANMLAVPPRFAEVVQPLLAVEGPNDTAALALARRR